MAVQILMPALSPTMEEGTLAKWLVKEGDTIKIKGRYEWNNRGGVLHWTHHDPKGRKESGWIYAGGQYYK